MSHPEFHEFAAVVVLLRDGRKLDLIVVEWTVDHLVGIDETDSLLTIPRQDIAQLQLSRMSLGKAAVLAVALAGVAAGVLLAVA